MKISKEVRIGILVTMAILIFFIGYGFLKNGTFLSNEREFYCFYDNVDGLQPSAMVQIRGLNVGHVTAMDLLDGKLVKVRMTIYKDVGIPTGTVASLESDLLGNKTIRLDPGPGPGNLKPGAEIASHKDGGVVDNLSSELTPRLKELKPIFAKIDSALSAVNLIIGAQNQKELADAIHSIKVTADNLSALSGALKLEGGEISSILHNVNSISGNLAKSNDSISQMLSHLNGVSRQLENSPIQKTVTNLQNTTAELNDVMQKINKGEGSLGLLINNKDFYNNLNNTLTTLNKLVADVNAHPSKYININIIGGKKKD